MPLTRCRGSIAGVALAGLLASACETRPRAPLSGSALADSSAAMTEVITRALRRQADSIVRAVKPSEIGKLPAAERANLVNIVLVYGSDSTPGTREWKAAAQRRLDAERERKTAAGRAAIAALRAERDEFQRMRWYKDRNFPYYANTHTVRPYIGKPDGGAPILRLLLRYAGEDWLFVQGFEFLVDGQRFSVTPPNAFVIKRDNNGEGVWEWYDVEVGPAERSMLDAVANSRSAKVRYDGQQYYRDRTIPRSEKLAIRQVLAAFDAMTQNAGGT